MKKSMSIAIGLLLGALSVGAANAAPLRSGYGGPEGYGALSQGPNDDGTSGQLSLPFSVNFYGNTFNNFYVNNNGNISFGQGSGTYTPSPFPSSSLPIIAPFWADVDTRNQPGGGAVYVAAPNANSVVVTWHDVGYYSYHNDLLNDFQMTLLNRADTGAGNFDIEFRYNQLHWTTGDASGGSGGMGGTPAQAGYDAGNHQNFFVLPGSFSSGILNLVNTSNVSQDTPGLWTMAIRGGATSDGSTPAAPLLPTIVNDDGFHFTFSATLGQTVYIDPEVAVGYEYRVLSGPNILSAMFPVIAGDTDGYDIYSLLGAFLGSVGPGGTFNFAAGGVDGFRLSGIDLAANLDPANTQAFVTGLTFAGTGTVNMTQDPIAVTVGGTVPEPSSALLLLLGALAIGASRSVRQRRATGLRA